MAVPKMSNRIFSQVLSPLRQSGCCQKWVSKRFLNLQEYQSKDLLSQHGINIQKFIVASSQSEAAEKLKTFEVPEYVVKAQILAGGRGKGTFSNGLKGGVKLTKNPKEAVSLTGQMIGNNLVTKQTDKNGVKVQKVLICEGIDIARETYVAILMDREFSGPVLVASPAGGVDIEEVAEKTPNLIYKEPIDIERGLSRAQSLKIAQNLQFPVELRETVGAELVKLYDMFIKVDATQVEINPFGETKDGRVVCYDAKFNFDDSAQFRQEPIFAMDDQSEVDPKEREATQYKLNYIGLPGGNIACLVNGAGLAMATMDIIKLYGGSPANFLDVGGNVQEHQVAQAFKILTSDSRVEAILVNVFGGIVNCATIANGLIAAFKSVNLKVPLVVRLEGTNVEHAKKLLSESQLPIITAENLDDAAEKAVRCIDK